MSLTTAFPFSETPPTPPFRTLADLLAQLGDVPPHRIRAVPPPGAATEADVRLAEGPSGAVCELVDGVLVEKTMGYKESLVAAAVLGPMREFVRSRELGIVLGADGTLRILPNQVRVPDACFVGWAKFPDGKLPDAPIPSLVPDLAVEVLSRDNTPGEMQRKLRDYFAAGVRLVWYIDPQTRSATAYTGVDRAVVIPADGVLSGGDVLPGFALRLGDLFVELEGRRRLE